MFQGSLAVAIILIDGSEKPNCQLGFELQSLHVIENRNKNKHCIGFDSLWLDLAMAMSRLGSEQRTSPSIIQPPDTMIVVSAHRCMPDKVV